MDNLTRREIFERFQAANPNPTTELHFNSSFELLIAVILSAQATDVSVNKATDKLYPIANTPQTLLELGEERLQEYVNKINLYRGKARNIIKTCQMLIDKHAGEVPTTREELEALPGVGRKTANVVLNTAFKQPTMAVDTHIFRVANRTGIAPGKNPLEVELNLLKVVDEEFILNAHHWLLLHGRYVCVARKPHCGVCCIRDLCEYKEKTL
ncbi:endonuclease III [Legionella beliardensis]|uniref:Endonuclease III n=1 Tax=Legionella beliardensis TaxID=91822 RepID=A0A378I5B3_9GAMM|nr:endonuclease III [Legionella beliardensis]STX30213.1 endonuclease III [Legionella beliardensis]